MSAFIVQDKTINAIATYAGSSSDAQWAFSELGYDLRGNPEDVERLAVDLHLMNCDAIDSRYGKGTAAGDVPTPFVYRYEVADKVHVYKHGRCLLYQCSEGNVPKHPLFKSLESFVSSLADRIISTMPQYETCRWD